MHLALASFSACVPAVISCTTNLGVAMILLKVLGIIRLLIGLLFLLVVRLLRGVVVTSVVELVSCDALSCSARAASAAACAWCFSILRMLAYARVLLRLI